MKKTIIEAYKENDEDAKGYLDFVKESIEEGSYFKDATNWYFFRYLSPICDRTMLLFGFIIAVIVTFFLYEMIKSAFPLVEEKPIFILEKDASIYFPHLIALKPKKGEVGYDRNLETVDEAILKYLIKSYIIERESFDFSDANIAEVNRKFNYLQSTSSARQYQLFQMIMGKENPESPINFFGKPVTKTVEIESIKLIKKEYKGFVDQAKYFLTHDIPTEAEIRFVVITKRAITKEDIKESRERFLSKISFSFDGVLKEKKDKLNFIVSQYRLFKIQ